MAKQDHILERRANVLAQKMQARIGDMALALQAADGRIPFQTKLSKGDALDWWSQHRYDTLGQQALAGMPPNGCSKPSEIGSVLAVSSLDLAPERRALQGATPNPASQSPKAP